MNMKIKRILKSTVAFLLCFITLFSVLSFADGTVFQLATTASAAAENQPVIIDPTYNYNFSKKTYKALLKQLNVQLKKKSFSKTAKNMIRDILYYEFLNYPQWRMVYKDLPSPKEYIKENLIDVIPLIGKIRLIDLNTVEGIVGQTNSDYSARTTPEGDYSNIRMYYQDIKSLDNNWDYLEQLETLAHEIRHVRDREAIINTRFPTDVMDDIFHEGGSDFHGKFVLPIRTTQHGEIQIETSTGAIMSFESESPQGYPYYLTFFEAMVFLAGYSVVDAVGEGANPNTVKKAIAAKYGAKKADTLWAILKKLPSEDRISKERNKVFKLSDQFFRVVLECIKTEVNALKKPTSVRKYMDVFRNFKMKILPAIYLYIREGESTYQYWELSKIESLLIKKIISTGALPRLYKNEKLNKRAIKEMLYSTERVFETTSDYRCCLPATIAQTRYIFSYEKGKGVLNMSYLDEENVIVDGYNEYVQFTCTFNEQKTISRTGDYL